MPILVRHDNLAGDLAASLGGGYLQRVNQMADQDYALQRQAATQDMLLRRQEERDNNRYEQKSMFERLQDEAKRSRYRQLGAELESHPDFASNPQKQLVAAYLKAGELPNGQVLSYQGLGAADQAKLASRESIADQNNATRRDVNDANLGFKYDNLGATTDYRNQSLGIRQQQADQTGAYQTGRLAQADTGLSLKREDLTRRQAADAVRADLGYQGLQVRADNASQYQRNNDLRLTTSEKITLDRLQQEYAEAVKNKALDPAGFTRAGQNLDAFQQQVAAKQTQPKPSRQILRPGKAAPSAPAPAQRQPGAHFQNDANSVGIVLPNGKIRAITQDDYDARVARIRQQYPNATKQEAMRIFNEQLQAETP